MTVTIRIQPEDFDIGAETARLRQLTDNTGAIATFTGLVRDLQDGNRIEALLLEHYPGMTEKSLRKIVEDAHVRWPLLGVTVVHRIGELKPGDQIVFVAVSSAHRAAAFAACEFIMDYLKTKAPFWKKCRQPDGEHWIAAKDSDQAASDRW
ncbi:MAG TPA: molybdopterin synthase catalytic subunit MoaE [Candidatus Acidoferrum sp.]|nr:molybdopterin synthase catalytic subunit MoaE [Candidatus Acidoferrum sp.]